jgi:hypothetical protein
MAVLQSASRAGDTALCQQIGGLRLGPRAVAFGGVRCPAVAPAERVGEVERRGFLALEQVDVGVQRERG